MLILNPSDFIEEESEIVSLGEPRQLRRIVQPYIEDRLHTRFFNALKKARRAGFREAYGGDIDLLQWAPTLLMRMLADLFCFA
jgi:hypothetical protein